MMGVLELKRFLSLAEPEVPSMFQDVPRLPFQTSIAKQEIPAASLPLRVHPCCSVLQCGGAVVG